MPRKSQDSLLDSDADFASLEKSVGYLVRNAHRTFDRTIAVGLSKHDVLSGQWSVLRVLWHEDDLSQVQIADRMRIERASLTTLIALMERKNLITKSVDDEDRRKQRIRLTSKGRKLEQVLVPIGESVNTKATRDFSVQELKTLRGLLLRLVKNLEH